MTSISLVVNGKAVTADVEPRRHLGDFLREDLMLTGTHLGCEHGVCGACTVLMDGKPIRSCILPAPLAAGAAIVTIEGLQQDPVAIELRRAFSAEHALQCGFCTPGMMMIARDIAIRFPNATEREIRRELAGHLCRCTGYMGIVRAIQSTARADWAQFAAGGPASSSEAKPLTATAVIRTDAAPAAQAAPDAPHSPPSTASDGFTRIDQRFQVPFPRRDVWVLFQDTGKVVECLPGASLIEPSDGTTVKGRFAARLGPMRASFTGEGTISTDAGHWTGRIDGRATDQASATRGRGRLTYRLSEGPSANTCDVDVTVEYALTGPLAQISRGGIARDLMSRITLEFAANVKKSLEGETVVATELRASALFMATLKSWLSRRWPFSAFLKPD